MRATSTYESSGELGKLMPRLLKDVALENHQGFCNVVNVCAGWKNGRVSIPEILRKLRNGDCCSGLFKRIEHIQKECRVPSIFIMSN